MQAPSNLPSRINESPEIVSANIENTEVIIDVANLGNLETVIDINSKPRDYNTYKDISLREIRLRKVD